MDVTEMLVRESIRDRYMKYNRSGDKGRLDELAECFTSDGTLEAKGHFTARGREAIVRCLRDVSPGAEQSTNDSYVSANTSVRHFVSHIRFDSVEDSTVRSSAYFLVCYGDAIDHWGTYRDVLTRVGAAWLFNYRLVVVDGKQRIL